MADVEPAHQAAGERRWLPREELVRRLRTAQADPGLRAELAALADETTDDLPVRI